MAQKRTTTSQTIEPQAVTDLIFFDIDGVIADFSLEFTRAAASYKKGSKVVTTADVQDWWYADLGLTKEDALHVMRILSGTHNLWRRLAPLPDLYGVHRIAQRYPVVFFTSRFPTTGQSVWQQTVEWLQAQGFFEPVVLVAQNSVLPHPDSRPTKVDLVKAWNPRLVVEDNPHELELLMGMEDRKSTIWAYDRAYNKKAPSDLRGDITALLIYLGLEDVSVES